jgi:hypothetical protein
MCIEFAISYYLTPTNRNANKHYENYKIIEINQQTKENIGFIYVDYSVMWFGFTIKKYLR